MYFSMLRSDGRSVIKNLMFLNSITAGSSFLDFIMPLVAESESCRVL